jgi:hypothetical protein
MTRACACVQTKLLLLRSRVHLTLHVCQLAATCCVHMHECVKPGASRRQCSRCTLLAVAVHPGAVV